MKIILPEAKTKTSKIKIFTVCFNEQMLVVLFNIGMLCLGVSFISPIIHCDNFMIDSYIGGFFGKNTISICGFFINPILAFFMMLAHQVFPTAMVLNWYCLILSAISLLKIHFILIKRAKSLFFKCLTFIVIGISTPIFYLDIQWTKPAAMASIAGFLSLFDLLFQLRIYRRITIFRIVSRMIPSLLLILGGLMLRSDCFFMCIPLFAVMGLYYIWPHIKLFSNKKSQKIIQQAAIVFSIMFVTAFSVYGAGIGIHNWMYPELLKQNIVRAAIDDYTLPEYQENKAAYQKLDVSENDYKLLENWDYQDPEFFTPELMRKIFEMKNQWKNSEQTNIVQLKTAFTEAQKAMWARPVYWYVWIVLAIIIILCSRSTIIFASLEFIVLNGVSWFLSYKGRVIDRVLDPLLFGVLIVLVFIVIDSHICKNYRQTLKNVCRIIAGSTIIVLAINSLPAVNSYELSNTSFINFARKDNELKKWANEFNPKQQIFLNKISENKQNLYFSCFVERGDAPIVFGRTDSLFRVLKPGSGENLSFLGQYLSQSPTNQKVLQNYNITNPFRSLIDPNVFVVTGDLHAVNSPMLIKNYLREHYYRNADFAFDWWVDGAIRVYTFSDDLSHIKASTVDSQFAIETFMLEHDVPGTAYMTFSLSNIKGYDPTKDTIYVRIYDDSSSRTYRAQSDLYYDGSQGIYGVVRPNNERLIQGHEYTAEIIIGRDGKYRKIKQTQHFTA